jgi:RNA polymerase sigma factor (sigma-70 family)
MATSQLGEVIRHLRRAALRDAESQTDGQLLEGFVSRREEAALDALVRRHAPMVWAVCRRALPHDQDAEDAFQATFLVLVRRAAAVVPREMVGNWLYGVAYQTAWKARIIAARRRTRERQVTQMPEPPQAETDPWREVRPLLDEELRRLPAKYRVAIVLCDVEGKTRAEAARQLGVKEGTLSGRLTRGRALLAKRLAKRLARHGLPLLAGLLAADAPAALVSATVNAARRFVLEPALPAGVLSTNVFALMEGVLRAMFWTKCKIVAAALLLTVVVGLSLGGLAQPTPAQETRPLGERVQRAERPRWEYKAVTRADIMKLAARDSKNRLTDGLNVLGNDGWELVGIEPGAVVGGSTGSSTSSSTSSGTSSTGGSAGGLGGTGSLGSSVGGSLPSTYLFKRPR